MKLLVTRPMTERATAAINARFDATFRGNDPLTEAGAAQAMRDYDAIIPTLGDAFTAAAFEGPLRCRILANFGAGYNHIDIAAAHAAGVTVTNTPDVVTEATADLAMALILMTLRRASEGERILRSGAWEGWNPTQLLGRDVTGRRVGIIGMGRIGKAIARRCHLGFGMEVMFFNRSAVSALDIPAQRIRDLHELLRASDVAVIAVPGGEETRGMIGETELAALGPNSVLINIARGDVVDEPALIAALETGRIAGAGLDVYAAEPHVPPALIAAPNTTLLPHLGTATEEVRTGMALRALENLIAHAEGRPLRDPVLPPRQGTGAQPSSLSLHITQELQETDMNWDIIQGKWKQLKGSVKEKWGELTDDELDVIDGNKDKLAGKLQEKYGWTKNEAEKHIDDHFRDR